MDDNFNKRFSNSFETNNLDKIYQEIVSKKSTKGIDKTGHNQFRKSIAHNLSIISEKCRDGTYIFSPYLEKLISKGRDRHPRLISIPIIRDRIVLYILKEHLQFLFPESVNRELVNYKIREIYVKIKSNTKLLIAKTDIKNFYSEINQEKLIGIIKRRTNNSNFLTLLINSIQNPTVPKDYNKRTKNKYFQYTGIPQGLSISNILADIYLIDFDTIFNNSSIYYSRYVDDILILSDKNIEFFIENVELELKKLNLKLNDLKTKSCKAISTFSFLGYQFKHPRLTVKKESFNKAVNSLASLFTRFRNSINNKRNQPRWLTDKMLMKRFESDLNEKITGAISFNRRYGWLFYYNEIDDMSVLHKLDKIVESFLKRFIPKDIKMQIEVKKYNRAYYETKYNYKGNYIHNYNKYDTITKMINYLNARGYLKPNMEYGEEEIIFMFNKIRESHLAQLLMDLGQIS